MPWADTLKQDPAYIQLVSTGRLCNSATFLPEDAHLPVVSRRVNGDATDAAILRFAHLSTATFFYILFPV